MTRYEYAHVTSAATDPLLLEVVNQMAKDRWEVYNTQMAVNHRSELSIGYFLRREKTDESKTA